MRLTYLDAGVLRAAFKANEPYRTQARVLIRDLANRDFVASEYLKLELLPMATYHRRDDEVGFYEQFFGVVSKWVTQDDLGFDEVLDFACEHGLGAVDAIHALAALKHSVHEFVTTEKPAKAFYRVPNLGAVFLAQE